MTMRIHGVVLAALLAAASGILIASGHWLHGTGILFGVAYGVIIQRSRMCFATAFYGNAYLMRGILLGLLIASIASYVLLKTGVVAAPHAVAFGIHVFVGSLLFGFLMPFVGGCMLGTIYRVGTGISTSAAAFLGILLGNLLGPVLVWDLTKALAAPTTGFVMSVAVGLEAALAVNLAAIAALLYLTKRAVPLSITPWRIKEPWPAWAGGLALGAVFAVQFAVWGLFVTQLPLARTMLYVADAASGMRLSSAWSEGTGPGASWVQDNRLVAPYADPLMYLILGVLGGAMVAALLSGEFQWFKVYGGWRTLARHFAAGVGMGIAVWIAVGCNVSGFYTATATLRPEVGWLYALGMYLGAKLGLRLMYKLA